MHRYFLPQDDARDRISAFIVSFVYLVGKSKDLVSVLAFRVGDVGGHLGSPGRFTLFRGVRAPDI